MFDYRQAKARATRAPRARRIDAVESLKHPFPLVNGDALAIIRHRDGNLFAVASHCNLDAAVAISHRIVNQVVNRLLQQRLFATHAAFAEVDGNLDTAGRRNAGQPANHTQYQLRHIDSANIVRCAFVKPRKRQNIVYEHPHGLSLGLDDAGKMPRIVGRANAFLDELRITAYDLQRRLHFVTHVSRELPAHLHRTRKLLVLSDQLNPLSVNPLQKRSDLAVCPAFQWRVKIDTKQGGGDSSRDHA